MELQKPVYVTTPFGGRVTVAVFGAPQHWGYAGTTRDDVERRNPGITQVLGQLLQSLEIRRALSPSPEFGVRIARANDLTHELVPGFFRGVSADGLLLECPGDAFFVASADCLTTIVYDSRSRSVVALHCGRDVLMDRAAINAGLALEKHRPFMIREAIRMLDELAPEPVRAHRSEIRVLMVAGIRSKTFDHPTVDHPYAEQNRLMIEYLLAYEEQTKMRTRLDAQGHPTRAWQNAIVSDRIAGKIDLFELVRRQFLQEGVVEISEDTFDTATATREDGTFVFHSNRRDKTMRNLVVVKLN